MPAYRQCPSGAASSLMYTAAPAGSVLMVIHTEHFANISASFGSPEIYFSASSASLYAWMKFENPTSKIDDNRSTSGRACSLAQWILRCRGKNHTEKATMA